MQRLLVFILAVVSASSAFAADEPEETLLKTAGLPIDPPALLDFLKQRSRESIAEGELDPFLKKLGSTEAKEASLASTALIIRGPLAIPALRRAINDLSAKAAAERAKKCLSQIEGRAGADLVAATTRLIGTKKPAQAVEVLLAYLPYADDAIVLEAIGSSLSSLAYPDGKVHPALLQAIEHDVPLVRATAIEAVSKADHPETRPAIAKKLADPSIPVRKRAALALAKIEDLSSLPVLVELLADLTKAERGPVEEMLRSFAGETVPKNLPVGDDEKDCKTLRDAWKEWWKKIDSPTILEEFRTRTLEPSERAKVVERIKQLGDGNYRLREKASQELVQAGAKVLADLRVAAKDTDGERARRAEDCITKINASDAKRVPGGIPRLVALRRPAGAASAMLGYLPFADDDDRMIAEVNTALTALVLDSNGKPDPAMVSALTDALPARRSAAAEALTKGRVTALRADVRKLLVDVDPFVRQAVAAVLTVAGEQDAVPVLIELLAELPLHQSWRAQDVLHQLAGDQSPLSMLGDTLEERKKYRDLWVMWWKANAASTDLAKLTNTPGYLGYTLLIQVGDNNVGRVAEVGRDGKIRWQIPNLKYPVDASILPGERVLITEWDGNRVGEWDFRGNLVWKKEGLTGRATNAQRLPNGNTFISTTNELTEVDRTGRVVYQVSVKQGLTAGYRSTNGEIVCLRNDGQVARYDTAGKELKTFPSNRDASWTSGIDLMRNGNILVSQPTPRQKVTEYTPDGKVVKEWAAPQVTTATKMSNGNILAASHHEQKVIEYDPSGKKVWEYKDEYHIFRARRR
ncbi:MAG: hypothetical protein EXS09_14860 [Gemmataceae bacterium]|nr:hypothetical protein [Gemmataceae bacterium]